MEIVWLQDEACQDSARVGGKAANLSKLALRYLVPPGFCITTGSEQSRNGNSHFFDPDLVAAYNKLGDIVEWNDPPVAVRSSAVAEDGRAASFAGQFATFLNVAGIEAVAAAIRECWASRYSTDMELYKRQQNLTSDGGLAVLIQYIIVADVSLVAFSMDPRSGDLNRIVVNAAWGLGESLVGGTVTPDSYTVSKSDLSILERDVADKQVMTIAMSIGTREVPVPEFLRTEPTLDDRELVRLADLLCEIEDFMGWPVDLECAYKDDVLYILQCRPVTAVGARK